MKKIKIIKFLTTTVIIIVAILSAKAQNKITANYFEQKVKATTNAQLIDVRTPEEYAGGHLAKANNINYNSTNFEKQIQGLDKSKPVFVYCLSGGRSAKAATKMTELGFKEVYDMQGGYLAWNNNGKPVIASSASSGMSLTDYNVHLKSDKLVLVDFNAPWCAPCKKMSPMLEEVSKEQKDKLTLVKINIDDNKELAKALHVETLPEVLIYKNGKEVWKYVGELSKADLMKAIQKLDL